MLPTRVHTRFSSKDIPDGSCNSGTSAHHRHQDPACQPSATSRLCPALQTNPTSTPCSSSVNPRASWPTCNVLGREPATNLRYSPPGSHCSCPAPRVRAAGLPLLEGCTSPSTTGTPCVGASLLSTRHLG